MNKIIYVFCGLDLHKETIKKCINSLRNIRDDVDIGVSTFGNAFLPPSIELRTISEEMGVLFHDCPRQVFNRMPIQEMVKNPRLPADVDCCELTGMLQISSHFYKEYDYEMVILMHPDTLTVRNGDNVMEQYLGQDYCMIAPLINLDPNQAIQSVSMFANMSGLDISRSRFRVTQAVLSFGKKYCLHLLEKYGSIENLWQNEFRNYVKWGDCSAINLYPSHEGFQSHLLHGEKQIISQQSFGEHQLCNMNFIDYLRANKKFSFVHIGHPASDWHPGNVSGDHRKEKYINWLYDQVMQIQRMDGE